MLTDDRDVSEFFEAAVRSYGQPKTVSNWVMREVLGAATEAGKPLRELPIAPEGLVELLKLVDAGRITAGSAREVFAEMAKTGEPAEAIVRARGLEAVSDAGELEGHAREVIAANADQVAKYKAGETKLLNFFVGQVMKRTGGKADPARLREVLARLLAL